MRGKLFLSEITNKVTEAEIVEMLNSLYQNIIHFNCNIEMDLGLYMCIRYSRTPNAQLKHKLDIFYVDV